MTYFIDVEEGSKTEFSMFGLKVKPEKGKMIIWPVKWTHAHKFIITGWMHFPIS